jgi:hypothetical protein
MEERDDYSDQGSDDHQADEGIVSIQNFHKINRISWTRVSNRTMTLLPVELGQIVFELRLRNALLPAS